MCFSCHVAQAEAPAAPYACTGFAVYGSEPIYGMNFDYPPCTLQFVQQEAAGRSVFEMRFARDASYVPVVGLNSEGLFASCQMLFPEQPQERAGSQDLYPWEVYYQALRNHASVSAVRELLGERRVVPSDLTLHVLLADPSGDALVVEPGPEAPWLTPIQGPWIVMTNFARHAFAGQDYRQVSGAGAERYQIAYAAIAERYPDFRPEDAMETLRLAANSDDQYPTLCSLVFLPARRQVLIALNQDYEHLWLAELDKGQIVTYAGYKRSLRLPLDAQGATSTQMQAVAPAGLGSWVWVLAVALAIQGVLLVGVIWWWQDRNERRQADAVPEEDVR